MNKHIKVKPLVWREVDCSGNFLYDKTYRATLLKEKNGDEGLLYEIGLCKFDHQLFKLNRSSYNAVMTTDWRCIVFHIGGNFPTLESAIATCQAHFEKFITGWVEAE